MTQELGYVRISAIVSFPRVEPGVSLVQRQPHASPFPQEHYPRGFEVIRWTEQYSELDSTSAASGTRKLRPLQDYFKIADEEGVLSAGRGVPSAGELRHLMKGNDREGGRALTSLSFSTRLLWAHQLQDNIKHAVETRLESAAVPPLEAVEQLSELEKKKERKKLMFNSQGLWAGEVDGCHKTRRSKTVCPRSHCWSCRPGTYTI